MKKMEKVKMTPLSLNPPAALSKDDWEEKKKNEEKERKKERRPRQTWVKSFKGIRVPFFENKSTKFTYFQIKSNEGPLLQLLIK